ncbi:unnamed protein product [marine sediment metagenome]|uniref:Uncharacterized protein n=1 Tax=marine sediment metagenome TaxID=412755 RepID=X0UDL3_9ZZZZ
MVQMSWKKKIVYILGKRSSYIRWLFTYKLELRPPLWGFDKYLEAMNKELRKL